MADNIKKVNPEVNDTKENAGKFPKSETTKFCPTCHNPWDGKEYTGKITSDKQQNLEISKICPTCQNPRWNKTARNK
jgi:hypothetical protein